MFPLQVLMAFMLLGLAASMNNIYIDTRMPEDEISPVLRHGIIIIIIIIIIKLYLHDLFTGIAKHENN
jgi:putative copper export protein